VYQVINRTANKIVNYKSVWPEGLLSILLEQGMDVIVISKYNKTIKVPVKVEENGIVSWEWKDYPMDLRSLK